MYNHYICITNLNNFYMTIFATCPKCGTSVNADVSENSSGSVQANCRKCPRYVLINYSFRLGKLIIYNVQ